MPNPITIVEKNGDLANLTSWFDRISPLDMRAIAASDYPEMDQYQIARNLIDCRGYCYTGTPFPTIDFLVNQANPALNGLAPKASVEGSVNVPEGSILTKITCTSLQPEGFSFRIFDKPTEKDLFYSEFATNYMVGNYTSNPYPENQGIVGQYYVMGVVAASPISIFGINVINRSANFNVCQLLLEWAIPGSYSNVTLTAIPIEGN